MRVGILLGSLGCAEHYPIWISDVPSSKTELCAIGVSGPTFYAEDALANSKASALAELARTQEVTVTSHMLMQTIGDTTTSDTAIREISGFDSDVLLKQARVRAQWVQPGDDRRYGAKGTVYTLMCMPTGS